MILLISLPSSPRPYKSSTSVHPSSFPPQFLVVAVIPFLLTAHAKASLAGRLSGTISTNFSKSTRTSSVSHSQMTADVLTFHRCSPLIQHSQRRPPPIKRLNIPPFQPQRNRTIRHSTFITPRRSHLVTSSSCVRPVRRIDRIDERGSREGRDGV
jgi:hypothetical protein